MNFPAKAALTGTLCVLASWAGSVLASRLPAIAVPGLPHAPSATAHPVPAPAKIATTPQPESGSLAMRRATARCESEALWQWLASLDEKSQEPFLNSVLDELLDRFGVAAVETSLALPDLAQRKRISDWFLVRFAVRDPWAALQIYQDHYAEFGGKWGSTAACEITVKACAISAEKTVEVMKATTQEESAWSTYAEFPPGFDFRQVLDYMAGAPVLPSTIPGNLFYVWAGKSPAEAVEWLMKHPVLKSEDGTPIYYDTQIVAAVAASDGPGRATALDSLATLPADRLEAVWVNISERDGAINPHLLEAAEVTDFRDTYLLCSLSKIRGTEILDPSWSIIPQEDREPLIDRALSQWEKDDPTPVATRARAHWRTAIEKQWAGMNP